ncbi:WW domain binding protein 4 [Dimargaris verticillata]|uniref:WW domain binding protein 4 n=1 Tax=Dimargaris verticillata TaxID=2761393 RepID=A0A9W8ECJ9_9FUNG|nr:WW domain binding protein 4 [Dimargaris verticillata]
MAFGPTRADRWVANAKHWCRYCKLYIQDNKATRNIHENGKKHRENVAQFLRDIDKKSRADLEQEKETQRQLTLIEEAAARQYSQDLQSSHPGASTTTSAATPPLSRTTPPVPHPAQPTYTRLPKAHVPPKTRALTTEPKGLTAAEAMVTPGVWELVDTPDPTTEPVADTTLTQTSPVQEPSLAPTLEQAPITKTPAATAAHDNDSDPEDLAGFRIREKQPPEDMTLPFSGTATSAGGTSSSAPAEGLFKKRKAGGQAKQRKLRTKK